MKKLFVIVASLSLILFWSCNNNEGTTTFVVRLTDSPGDYEEVNIDLVSVEVHSDTDGWTTLNSNADIYDLLTLTDGVETVIADDELPSGRVSQLRLILGDNNSVVVDGEEFPLTVPSGSESGLKLQINADLEEGITYSVLLDFDAAKSIVNTGSDKYILKPVIKTITEAQDGAIKGSVLPAELSVAVYALSGSDTLSTSYAPAGNADYFLGGLADGSYTVSIDPGDLSGYQGVIIENIEVTIGNVTELSATELIQ
ncbi:MAG: carbohydrate-binding protein [Bacteroidetes bacterium]|nr:MAG: carbohydrate-binding protein [Bacteroidota bacterium]